jgi:hypothetical protein
MLCSQSASVAELTFIVSALTSTEQDFDAANATPSAITIKSLPLYTIFLFLNGREIRLGFTEGSSLSFYEEAKSPPILPAAAEVLWATRGETYPMSP